MTYAALADRGLLGLVFAVSAFTKLRSRLAFQRFASWLSALPGLPALGRPAAAAMAAAEGGIAVLVALPWTWRAGLVLAAAALAVFLAGTLAVVRAGVRTPCQCFGTSAVPLGRRHVARNAVLCAAAAIGAAGVGPGTAVPAGIALCLGVAVFAAMFVLFLDDLAGFLAGSGASGPGPGQD